MERLILSTVVICILTLPRPTAECTNNQTETFFNREDIQVKAGLLLNGTKLRPAFRFYHYGAGGYVSKSNKSREIIAQIRDPFSPLIEWKWIPRKGQKGFFIRNKANKYFLCFNKYGRPVARRRRRNNYCLLHGFILRERTIAPPKTHVGANVLRPTDEMPILAVPSFIFLVARYYSPPWYMGFCPNGHSYANDDPYVGDCVHPHLLKHWNYLLICPPIPGWCRSEECMWSKKAENIRKTCPQDCQFYVFCGGLIKRLD